MKFKTVISPLIKEFELRKSPVIIRVNKFNEETAKKFVDSMAAFQIVDNSIKACSDDTPEGEECDCATPWDYCCEIDKLPHAMAFIRFNDNQGNVHMFNAKSLFPVNELSTVVVKGIAKRDDAGNLTILADGIYVRN